MTERKDKVTADDILASLTRQAEFKQKYEKEDRLALADIAEEEDLSRIQGFSSEPKSPFNNGKGNRLRTFFIRIYALNRTGSSLVVQFDLEAI